jgi:hypothetical protein
MLKYLVGLVLITLLSCTTNITNNYVGNERYQFDLKKCDVEIDTVQIFYPHYSVYDTSYIVYFHFLLPSPIPIDTTSYIEFGNYFDLPTKPYPPFSTTPGFSLGPTGKIMPYPYNIVDGYKVKLFFFLSYQNLVMDNKTIIDLIKKDFSEAGTFVTLEIDNSIDVK